MNDKNANAIVENTTADHSKAIRERTDSRELRPWLLLGITLAVSAILAAISYGLQIYFIGPG